MVRKIGKKCVGILQESFSNLGILNIEREYVVNLLKNDNILKNTYETNSKDRQFTLKLN